MFPGPLAHSLHGKASELGVWQLEVINLRDFANDRHKTVDDYSCGGGSGMVMRPDILGNAIDHYLAQESAHIIYMSPRGARLNQQKVEILAQMKNIIIICGRYEGIDQRVIDYYHIEEVSIGDYIISGGELAAMCLIDACLRHIPGVIGKSESVVEDSFSETSSFPGILEYPHYTKPTEWKNLKVPEILLSGHHQQIKNWRIEQAKSITKTRRPDLLQ